MEDRVLATREIPLGSPRHAWAWTGAQMAGVVTVLSLVVLLLIAPEPTLAWTWNVVVPVLPATFLITPAIWRNVCPLATLNELPGRFGLGSRGPTRWMASGVIAMLALALLVPARRALLNGSGPAFAVTLVALALIALALGAVFSKRSGFCNGVCPVLPVERLYGQHPLVDIRGSRCASCTFCTPTGCIDLARGKAMVQMLGRARHSARWLLTPTGAFAAAFPGLIYAYFTTPDVADGAILLPFGRAIAFSAASFAILGAAAAISRLRAALAITLLGAISFGLYYWYAAPGVAAQLGAGAVTRDGIRAAAGLLLAIWLGRPAVWRRAPKRD